MPRLSKFLTVIVALTLLAISFVFIENGILVEQPVSMMPSGDASISYSTSKLLVVKGRV